MYDAKNVNSIQIKKLIIGLKFVLQILYPLHMIVKYGLTKNWTALTGI